MERLVSVIIPTYNAAPYVREAIDSVLGQTYPNIEIIVVDDGSTDTTKDLLQAYLHKGKITVISQENKGPAAARNAGMQKARGTYIAFLDADDVWLPEKLARQLPLFDNPDIALVYADMEFFGTPFSFKTYGEMAGPFKRGAVVRKLIKRNFIANSSVVIRAAILETIGLFNEDRKFFAVEDYEFYLRVARTHAIDFVAAPLVRYRLHSGQISQGRSAGYARLAALYAYLFTLPEFKSYKFLIILKYIENKIKSFVS